MILRGHTYTISGHHSSVTPHIPTFHFVPRRVTVAVILEIPVLHDLSISRHPTGSEDTSLQVSWTPVNAKKMEYMLIKSTHDQTSLRIQSHLFGQQVALWNIFIPNLVASYRQDNNDKNPKGFRDSKTWLFFGFTLGLLCVVILLLCFIVWGNRKSSRYSQLLRGSSGTSHSINLW